MQVLVVFAHPDPNSFNRALCDRAVTTLARKHEVTLIDLYAEGFDAAMTTEERIAYETSDPIRCDKVRASAELIRNAEALVFVYPTWWFGLPAVLKGWLERVLVPGVGFFLDEKTNKVVPGLRRVRRIAGITTYGSSRWNVALMNDGGRRIIGRCLRMMSSKLCRRTWLGLYGMDRTTDAQRHDFLATVEQKLARW